MIAAYTSVITREVRTSATAGFQGVAPLGDHDSPPVLLSALPTPPEKTSLTAASSR